MPAATTRPRPTTRSAAALAAGVAVLAGAACGSVDEPRATATSPPRASAPPRPEGSSGEPSAEATAGPGPTVQQIQAALDAISPTRHPRENTGSCAAAGCIGLVTTGAVSIYQWPDVAAAARFLAKGGGTADRIGPYVLSYRTTEQHSTPPQVRQAYADKVRQMVGPVP
jgi:hypothetical protein